MRMDPRYWKHKQQLISWHYDFHLGYFSCTKTMKQKSPYLFYTINASYLQLLDLLQRLLLELLKYIQLSFSYTVKASMCVYTQKCIFGNVLIMMPKAQETKENTQIHFIKIQNRYQRFCVSKNNINGDKRHLMEWEKMFVNYVSAKSLIPRVKQELVQHNAKRGTASEATAWLACVPCRSARLCSACCVLPNQCSCEIQLEH